MINVNKKKLRPYGSRLDDGAVQVSFAFPVRPSPEAKEAARKYLEGMGLGDIAICAMEPMGKSFTYFVAYGCAKHTVDLTRIKAPKREKGAEAREQQGADRSKPSRKKRRGKRGGRRRRRPRRAKQNS